MPITQTDSVNADIYTNPGKYTYESGNLKIYLRKGPVFSYADDRHEISFYGNIYNQAELRKYVFKGLAYDNIDDLLNKVSGYFLAIINNKVEGKIILANDIFGNFRTYFIMLSKQMVVSDDWKILYELLKNNNIDIAIDEPEKHYFNRHRYTTGGGTLFPAIKKMLPGSIISFGDGIISNSIYFKANIKKLTDNDRYISMNRNYLIENMESALANDHENILFFSGGVDSTYLAVLLKEIRVKFRTLFLNYQPQDLNNATDFRKAESMAEHLNLDLDIITVPIENNNSLIMEAIKRHAFDKAFSIPFYYASKLLYEKYGPCNIINGQSSDSIYCWGASTKTIGGLIQRYITSTLYLNNNKYLRYLISKLVKYIYKIKWRIGYDFDVPTEGLNYWAGLLDPQGYLPVVLKNKDLSSYRDYIRDIASMISRGLDNDPEAIIMYMKMMYLQGPSNMPVIESANAYGHNIVMPYLDARIVFLKMKYQNEFKNIFHPRYVLEEDLRSKFKVDIKRINKTRRCEIGKEENKAFNSLIRKLYKEWDRILEQQL